MLCLFSMLIVSPPKKLTELGLKKLNYDMVIIYYSSLLVRGIGIILIKFAFSQFLIVLSDNLLIQFLKPFLNVSSFCSFAANRSECLLPLWLVNTSTFMI